MNGLRTRMDTESEQDWLLMMWCKKVGLHHLHHLHQLHHS